jgi:tetratricopeptide (TPR) repeat protein
MHADLDRLLREGHARSAGTPTPPADDTAARAARVVEEAQHLLAAGKAAEAVEGAKEALRLAPQDKSAQELLRIAEGEALSRRVEGEIAEIRAAMERARAEGHLQKALGFCRRLLELNPSDPELTKIASQIEMAIRDREVEDLCGLALAYAADGDTDLAQKIAARIEQLSPRNRKYLQLRKYLDEETARRKAEALTSAARDLLAFGNLAEAHAAAEEALQVYPDHAVAREIRDRTGSVLAAQEKRAAQATTTDVPRPPQPPAPAAMLAEAPAAAPSRTAEAPVPSPVSEEPALAPTPEASPPSRPVDLPAPVPPPPALPPPEEAPPPPPPTVVAAPEEPPMPPLAVDAPTPPEAQPATAKRAAGEPVPLEPAPVEPPPLTPLPEGEPGNPEAARLVESARRQLRERLPQKALALLEEAAALAGDHPGIQRLLSQTRIEARRAEIESLTTAALDAFVQNKHRKARTAVEKALALDPKNRKAQELLKILGSLG